jgi:cell division protein FtsN
MAAKRNSRNNKETKSMPWGPMILSFVVGAFVMFLLHIKDNVPADSAESTASEKTQNKAVVQPKFDFYTLLPEMEVVVDDTKTSSKAALAEKGETKPATTAAVEPQDKGSYLLQVGSFRKLSDADAFRAKLAFLGVESRVQTVTIDNKETWHRVQIGPISGRAQADALQKKLRDNNFDSLLMRAKQS